jgi:hypothetical protein
MTDTITQTGFLMGVLEGLHIAIGREAIARKLDLSVEQLEMIREICDDARDKSSQL